MANNSISRAKFDLVKAAILAGHTRDEICKINQVSPKTVLKIKNSPDYNAYLRYNKNLAVEFSSFSDDVPVPVPNVPVPDPVPVPEVPVQKLEWKNPQYSDEYEPQYFPFLRANGTDMLENQVSESEIAVKNLNESLRELKSEFEFVQFNKSLDHLKMVYRAVMLKTSHCSRQQMINEIQDWLNSVKD